MHLVGYGKWIILMKMRKKIAVFASGSGTNAENIIRYFRDRESAQVVLVISSRPDAYVVERARKLQVPCHIAGKEAFATPGLVISMLHDAGVDMIVLAGFLLKVPEEIVRAYPDAIVNIHPALLPKFGGKGMYGDRVHNAVIEAGEQISGITIHYVNEHYDEGTAIARFTCPVLKGDTPQSLAARVHELEYRYFPEVIEQVATSGK